MIQIWDAIKGEWVDKFSAPQNEIEAIAAMLEQNGLRVIVVGDGYMPLAYSSLDMEKAVIQALLDQQ